MYLGFLLLYFRLGLVIEFRDGKPILKGVTNKFLEEDNENQE